MSDATPANPRAYLIDSSIYVFRAWYTMPDDIVDVDGNPMNALYGFADTLVQIIEHRKPQYVLCAFDENSRNCWRREIYPEYKANRDPAPEDLKRQFAFCRELLTLSGITNIASPRYEADDIIGTFSRALKKQGMDSTIITADKDLMQLVQDKDAWWDFAKNRVWDAKGVEKNWGVPPRKIADLLALCGDKVDNIEGIPGVGVKTAANMLVKFDDVEALIENAEHIGLMRFRGAVRVKNLLKMHQEKVRLAKQLTVIKDDPELNPTPEQITFKAYDEDKLNAFFDRVNFGVGRRKKWLETLNHSQ